MGRRVAWKKLCARDRHGRGRRQPEVAPKKICPAPSLPPSESCLFNLCEGELHQCWGNWFALILCLFLYFKAYSHLCSNSHLPLVSVQDFGSKLLRLAPLNGLRRSCNDRHDALPTRPLRRFVEWRGGSQIRATSIKKSPGPIKNIIDRPSPCRHETSCPLEAYQLRAWPETLPGEDTCHRRR